MPSPTDKDLNKLISHRNGCKAEPRSVVENLEKELGVVFPESLRRLWAIEDELGVKCEGSFAEPSGFGLYALRENHFEWVSSTIMEMYALTAEEFPRVVPIGNDGGGDQLCLDYRFREDPVILKYDHEIGYRTLHPFYFLARNFDEYVDRCLSSRQEYYRKADEALTPEELTKFMGFPSAETYAFMKTQRECRP